MMADYPHDSGRSHLYPFATGNRLEDRNTYFYIPFNGQEFINAWIDNREQTLAELEVEPKIIDFMPHGSVSDISFPVNTSTLMSVLMNALVEKTNLETLYAITNKLLQRFEVTKRIHTSYPENYRASADIPYDDLSLYVKFACLLQKVYENNPKLYYINGLIKVIDTLSAMDSELDQEGKSALVWLINSEKHNIDSMLKNIEMS